MQISLVTVLVCHCNIVVVFFLPCCKSSSASWFEWKKEMVPPPSFAGLFYVTKLNIFGRIIYRYVICTFCDSRLKVQNISYSNNKQETWWNVCIRKCNLLLISIQNSSTCNHSHILAPFLIICSFNVSI